MKPYLSLIIPYHNSEATIGPLLESVYASKSAPTFEVIIVDDGSKINIKDQISNIKNSYPVLKRQRNIRYFRLIHNKGPAAARNRGAKEAKGKFIVFLDSDVRLFPDTLHNLAKIYLDDPDVVALTGVWVKEQVSNDFFPNFKALRDWSYWINERDKSGYYFLFSTRIASIKKSVFLRLGGFDEMYSGALVEDIELTYRIARRYAIIFAPNVRVHHEFEGFWPIAMKYFLRSYHWSHLYARRKKFDPVATTLQEAITAVSGVGIVGLTIAAVISGAVGYWATAGLDHDKSVAILKIIMQINIGIISLLAADIAFHIFLIRKFLVFMYQEKGLIFAVKGFFTGLILYCFIAAGALWGKLRK
jgi:glycosyltransferase involved in cell wall biosynthesis